MASGSLKTPFPHALLSALAVIVWAGPAGASGETEDVSPVPGVEGRPLFDRLGLAVMDEEQPAVAPLPPEPPQTEFDKQWHPLVPTTPPAPGFFDAFKFKPAYGMLVSPIGSPWFLPGELGGSKTAATPGPGVGLGLEWRPSTSFRLGFDMVARAEQLDENNRPHDWNYYLCPGIDYIPYPHSPRPFSVGVVFPLALNPEGQNWVGAFILLRWDEILNRLPKFGAKN